MGKLEQPRNSPFLPPRLTNGFPQRGQTPYSLVIGAEATAFVLGLARRGAAWGCRVVVRRVVRLGAIVCVKVAAITCCPNRGETFDEKLSR